MLARFAMPDNANARKPLQAVDKPALRKAMLARRKALAPEAVLRAGRSANALLDTLPRWREAREVLVYLDFGGEVATGPVIEALLARGVRVLAPRCRPGEAGVLDVACLTCLSELSPGAYGILEPDPARCPALECVRPDAALIPAVAFDLRGGRLGFGQGYYDRLLASPGFEHTFLAGLAHAFQVVEALPLDPWDRPVHAVVTEKEILWPIP